MLPISEPDTIRFPSGENATEKTTSEWAPNGPVMVSPDWASQTRTVPSYEPDTIHFPFGENAAEHTSAECPVKTLTEGHLGS